MLWMVILCSVKVFEVLGYSMIIIDYDFGLCGVMSYFDVSCEFVECD